MIAYVWNVKIHGKYGIYQQGHVSVRAFNHAISHVYPAWEAEFIDGKPILCYRLDKESGLADRIKFEEIPVALRIRMVEELVAAKSEIDAVIGFFAPSGV